MIAQELSAIDPDVLCVQECNRANDFAGVLPGHAMLYCPKLESPAQTAGSTPDGCAIFIRRSMFHILDVNIFYYSNLDAGKAKSAGAIVVGVKDKRTEEGLVFATTHLKAKEKPEFEIIRHDQLSQLLQKVEGMRSMVRGYVDRNVCVVLTGDFNSPPGESCYSLMRERKYESVYNSMCSIGETCGETPSTSEYASGEPAFTTMKVREELVKRTIDYIWVSHDVEVPSSFEGFGTISANDSIEDGKKAPPLKLVKQAVYSIPTEADIGPEALPSNHYPSDHVSIAAKLAWKSTA